MYITILKTILTLLNILEAMFRVKKHHHDNKHRQLQFDLYPHPVAEWFKHLIHKIKAFFINIYKRICYEINLLSQWSTSCKWSTSN